MGDLRQVCEAAAVPSTLATGSTAPKCNFIAPVNLNYCPEGSEHHRSHDCIVEPLVVQLAAT